MPRPNASQLRMNYITLNESIGSGDTCPRAKEFQCRLRVHQLQLKTRDSYVLAIRMMSL